MSFSKPKLKNPANKFIQFKGDTGEFRYYDKEQEQNIVLHLPLYMIVLDELTTITGYSDYHESGIYSNEIHNLNTEVLHVRSFKGSLEIVGKYKEIRDQLKANGGKFCKSVYAMLITGKNEYELVNFQLSGIAFSSWMDKRFDVEKYGVIVKPEMEEGKKGSISYKIPKFSKLNVTKEYYDAAYKMDEELQQYLEEYKSRQGEKPQEAKDIEQEPVQEKTANEVAAGMYQKNEPDPTPMPDETDDLPF